jgi:hypothetical protein
MTLAQKLYEASCAGMPRGAVVPFERQPVEVQAIYEELASAATLHLAGSDASVSAARVEELLDLLAGVLFSPTPASVQAAQAALVEYGRKLPEPEPKPAVTCSACGAVLGHWTRVHFASAKDARPCPGSWK